MPDLRCHDHLARVLCPDGHCAESPQTHDPNSVELESIPFAVSVYHGRALCLQCFASYLDEWTEGVRRE